MVYVIYKACVWQNEENLSRLSASAGLDQPEADRKSGKDGVFSNPGTIPPKRVSRLKASVRGWRAVAVQFPLPLPKKSSHSWGKSNQTSAILVVFCCVKNEEKNKGKLHILLSPSIEHPSIIGNLQTS